MHYWQFILYILGTLIIRLFNSIIGRIGNKPIGLLNVIINLYETTGTADLTYQSKGSCSGVTFGTHSSCSRIHIFGTLTRYSPTTSARMYSILTTVQCIQDDPCHKILKMVFFLIFTFRNRIFLFLFHHALFHSNRIYKFRKFILKKLFLFTLWRT